MSSKKVSDLTSTTSLNDSDVFVVNHAGSTNKIEYSAVVDNLSSKFIKLPANPDPGDYLQYDSATGTWVGDPALVNINKGIALDSGISVKLGGGVNFSGTGEVQVIANQLKGITLDNGVAVKNGSGIGFDLNGLVEVKYNNLKGISADGNGLAVKLDNGGGLQFNAGGEIQPVVNGSKGIKLDSGLAVKLDPIGGLQFNGTGEIKLSSTTSSSSIIYIRPSDTSATDLWTTRTNVGGVLSPPFRTLIGANEYAKYNIIGNYTIYIHEDTYEGEDMRYVYVTPTLRAEYITQATVDNIFGTGSGMKQGIYVWTNTVGARMIGGIHFTALGNNTKDTAFYYVPLFKRPGGNYVYERYFDEAPRAINFNVYYTNDTNLDWSSTVEDIKWGTAASRLRNWSERLNYNQTDLTYVRHLGGGGLYNSRGDITNINFVSRHNCNDCTISDIQNSNIGFHNVTFSMLGSGHYKYGALRCISSEIRLNGYRLYSSQDNADKYPGYGIAFVGNNFTAGQDLSAATILGSFVTADVNSWLRFIEYNAFSPNNSRLNAAVIMDGDFSVQTSFFCTMSRGSIIDFHPACFVKNNLNLRRELINDSDPSRKDIYTVGQSVFPVSFNKNNSLSIDEGFIKKYTIDGTTTNVDARASGFPVFRGYNEGNKFGNFILDSAINTYKYVFDTNIDEFRSSNIAPTSAYAPGLSGLLDFNVFYTFTENGAVSSLNYGAGVRP